MWFVSLLIGLAINIVAYLIMPGVKGEQRQEYRDMDDPGADMGLPKPVAFGSIRVTGLNILWWGEKTLVMREVDSDSGKK